MKKYKNISGTTLHIDCMSCTIHMEPEQTLFLPRSRDTRFYTKIGKLVIIRKEPPKPRVKKKASSPPRKRGRKRKQKWKKPKEENIKQEKVENK